MATPPDLTTSLKAVNILLAGIGEQPVTTLDEVESSTAEQAMAALDEASRSVQLKGWFWNREDDYPLSPNEAGEVELPINCLVIHEARNSSGSDDLVERARKLYNRTDHTYTFEQGTTVYVDMTVYLTWDELPETAKHTIFYLAQRRFQMRELTSSAIDQQVADDLSAAMTTLEQFEDSQGPHNILSSTGSLGLTGAARRRS